jgi:hypothetical protein
MYYKKMYYKKCIIKISYFFMKFLTVYKNLRDKYFKG